MDDLNRSIPTRRELTTIFGVGAPPRGEGRIRCFLNLTKDPKRTRRSKKNLLTAQNCIQGLSVMIESVQRLRSASPTTLLMIAAAQRTKSILELQIFAEQYVSAFCEVCMRSHSAAYGQDFRSLHATSRRSTCISNGQAMGD